VGGCVAVCCFMTIFHALWQDVVQTVVWATLNTAP
jgi:hypothetical protein